MTKNTKILVADDSEINRAILADILTPDYEVLEACDGEEALYYLKRYHSEIALVLLDIVMPKLDGFDVLTIMNRDGMLNNIPVIIVSSETSAAYIDHAYNLGAAEYISRPFHKMTVRHRIENTVKLYAKQKYLENIVTDQILEKEKNNVVMVDILSHIVEFRNGESGLHVLHIRTITELLLRQLQRTCSQYHLTPARIALMTNASALHDIGKISIPGEILNKPGRLTAEEFEIIKTHSVIGSEMLEDLTYYQDEELVQVARDICRWHHERYDGGGYPDSLKGEQIPIAAQVVSLADVYDALTSERVYKPAYSHEQTLEMIFSGECGVFNPVLLDALKAVEDHLESEVKLRSAGKITRDQIHELTYEGLNNYGVSDRTLDLLEQERTKYQFYASLTREIQFEYTYGSDTLIISEWGAAQAGIPESVPHPRNSPELFKIFAEEDFWDLHSRLKQVTPDKPIVSEVYRLTIKGERRWYKAVVRPIWGLDENVPPTKIIGKLVDNDEEQNTLDQLALQAMHDDLTGLLGKNYARKEIEQHLACLKKKKAALMIVDLDIFKSVNDQYGHLYGDKMLKTVGSRLKKSVRNSDVVARIGGDEFLVYVEYKEHIGRLAERVFHTVSGSYDGVDVSVSIGIALAKENGTTYEELFFHADQALYASKQAGRNQYRFYEDSMQTILLPYHMDLETGQERKGETLCAAEQKDGLQER
ncbi:diguanylate cyclase [Clostridium sp. AF19-22AC]|jgi:diguanylate cyclase (GGDEF)-like protein|uniref:diguanylate cyclase n=1 Tax=Clostridia TaxID=186801 RepID=UPI000E4E4B8C|nr:MULTISPECIES: diguanylate cyclase [Clostridia]RHR33149.1 diguanylate cyclase [Clostridium sp. AF19-22AC]